MKMKKRELKKYLKTVGDAKIVVTNMIFDLYIKGYEVGMVGMRKNEDGTFTADAVRRAWNPEINMVDNFDQVDGKPGKTELDAKIELYLSPKLKEKK